MKPTWSPTRRSWRLSTRSSACSAGRRRSQHHRAAAAARAGRGPNASFSWPKPGRCMPNGCASGRRTTARRAAARSCRARSCPPAITCRPSNGAAGRSTRSTMRSATPTCCSPRAAWTLRSRIDDGPRLAKTYPRQGRSPFNLTGHPAIAMQSGISKTSGLPLSVQFVGGAHDEVTLLRVAAAYERVTQWRHRRPPAMYRGGAQRECIPVTA